MDLSSRLLSTPLRLFLIWAILFLPAGLALWLMAYQSLEHWLMLITATACVTLGLWLLRSLPRPLNVVLLCGLIAVLLIIRIVQLGLVNFSGTDFSSEFFLHLDWQSLKASWHIYGWRIPLGVGLTLAIIALCLHLSLHLPRLKPSHSLASGLGLAVGLLWSMHSLPEGRLYLASIEQNRLAQLPALKELMQRWETNPMVQTHLTPKSKLQVEAPENPQNLLLIYLESVGMSVIQNDLQPNLMPYLRQLNQQHSLVPHFHASGFITIEGIVNSQCGTLFPFNTGNDSLANGANLAEQMPCLGDILQQAGYTNHYLGGATLDFSGKGEFLRAHGYPEPRGISYWNSIGLKSRPGNWGLSDPDLFSQASKLLSELQSQNQPFNLNLLTIGTHIPGFTYEECHPYPHSDDIFLNSVNCTDQLLQQWLESAAREGLLHNTLVVITADHQIFNNHQMRNAFGELAPQDRRLPLIVFNAEDIPLSKRERAASYDLAPTILELLNIEHNAVFPLGKSVFEQDHHPLYFVNRYEDVVASNGITIRSTESCEVPEPSPHDLSQLMSQCQKGDLFDLLRRQVEFFSDTQIGINCHLLRPLHVSLGTNSEIEFNVSDINISDRFTKSGCPRGR